MRHCGSTSYECHCMCHGEDGESIATHCFPCCERCPRCGKHIAMGFMEEHTKESHPTHEPKEARRESFMRRFQSELV